MRLMVGVLLAVLVTGSAYADRGSIAVTIAGSPIAGSCAVRATATVIAYDAASSREVTYRFVRSDGSASAVGRLTLAGTGAVAQSVSDRWTPRGPSPWVALEVLGDDRVRSPHLAVARCAHGDLASN